LRTSFVSPALFQSPSPTVTVSVFSVYFAVGEIGAAAGSCAISAFKYESTAPLKASRVQLPPLPEPPLAGVPAAPAIGPAPPVALPPAAPPLVVPPAPLLALDPPLELLPALAAPPLPLEVPPVKAGPLPPLLGVPPLPGVDPPVAMPPVALRPPVETEPPVAFALPPLPEAG